MSPAAALLLAAIVIIAALPVVFFGRLISCLIGAIILACALGLAATQYTEAVLQLKTYRNHAKKTGIAPPSAPASPE